jgi:hypothetical protein
MVVKPGFERNPDHNFQVREKVFIIDNNGFDIWEAQIKDIQGGSVTVHYPGFPDDDEAINDFARVLVDGRVNRRIFNSQEATRQAQLPALSDGEKEPFSDDDDDEDKADEYEPGSPKSDKKRSKKGKKPKKAVPKARRPEGVRSSPRRGG